MGNTVKPNYRIKTLSQKTLKDVEKLKFAFYDWYKLERNIDDTETDEARQTRGRARLTRVAYLCDLMRLVNYLTIHAVHSYEEEEKIID